MSSQVAWINVKANMPDLNGVVSGNGRMGTFALGGTVPGLAGGGGGGTITGPGTAGSDSAGIYRLAHGEEVISNVFGQADRWRATLKAINAGATTMPTAGTVRAQSITTAPAVTKTPIVVEQHFHIHGVVNEDPQVIGNIVGRASKDALAGVVV